jgi:hypothetical protein
MLTTFSRTVGGQLRQVSLYMLILLHYKFIQSNLHFKIKITETDWNILFKCHELILHGYMAVILIAFPIKRDL